MLIKITAALTVACASGIIIILRAPTAALYNIILLHTLKGYLDQRLEHSTLAPIGLFYLNLLNQSPCPWLQQPEPSTKSF